MLPAGLIRGDPAIQDTKRDPLRCLNRQRGVAADLFGKRHRCRQHIGRRHHPVCKSKPVRRLGIEWIAGEQMFHRDLGRKLIDDPERAGGRGEEADHDLRKAETGMVCCHDQVAGKNDLQPSAKGTSIDRRNDRLRNGVRGDACVIGPSDEIDRRSL